MRPATVPSLLALAVIASVPVLAPYSTSPPTRPSPHRSTLTAQQVSQGTPREIDFPYYSLREGFRSLLQLVSDSPISLPIAVTVRSSSGRTILTKQMTIHSQEKLMIDLGVLLVNLGADSEDDFQEGSISVSYVSDTRPIMGQITVSNASAGLVFESRLAINDPDDSNIPAVLEGLWWSLTPDGEARVMVANTLNSPITADVSLTFSGQRHPTTPINFGPYETKVLSITELLARLNVEAGHISEGGITIAGHSPSPALIATGMTADRESGFSTTMHFPPAGTPDTSSLFAPGVPIGSPSADSPFAFSGTFTPHVVVRNLSSSPQTATVTIEYPGGSGSQSVTLDPLKLGPYATTDLAMDGNSLDKLPLPLPFCSIQVRYSGPPGSAIAEISSVERHQDLVVDSKLGDPNDRLSGSGINPWHLDEQTESFLFLTNEGNDAAHVAFQIQAEGVRYHLTDLKINPHETRAIDIRKLRDAQKPDLFGNKIPAKATDGSLFWVKMDKVPMIGRTLVFSLRNGISSNFDCSCTYHCAIGYSALNVAPTSVNLLIGNSKQFTATETWEDCSGLPYYYDRTLGASWTSGSACNVSSTGNATGVAGGLANITATYSDDHYHWSVAQQECIDAFIPKSNFGTANVQVPTSLSIVVGTDLGSTSEAACTTSDGHAGCGVTRTFKYQVNDQNGNPIAMANMPFGDVICNTSTNQLNLKGYKTTCGGTTGSCSGTQGPCDQFTDPNGQFTETLTLCAPACKPSGTCTTAGQTIANQTWTINGTTLNSDVKSISYQCNKILVNGK